MKSRTHGVLVACAGIAANAAVSLAAVDASDPHTWGPDRPYVQSSPPAHFVNSFFDIFTEISLDGSSSSHTPPPPGSTSTFDGQGGASALVWLNGLPPGVPYLGNYHCSFFDVFTDLVMDPVSGDRVGSFDTEMLQLDLTFPIPGGVMMLRESPTLPSKGKTSIRQTPGGMFHIDSFFDVFTELSLDGGQTWTPGDQPMRLSVMPTPGAATILGLGGLVAGRRRQR